MATRSTIAVLLETGQVIQTYCHFDGYIGGVGKTLELNYTTRESATKLVESGHICELENTVEATEHLNTDEPNIYESVDDYRNRLNPEEYNYMYFTQGWAVYSVSTGKFYSVGDKIKE